MVVKVVELAAVEVPAGEALVLSPRHVVGVLAAVDAPVRLRARWHLTTWQSWVGGRFRHFVWSGPCVLVVTARRGIRTEFLAGGARRVPPRPSPLRPTGRCRMSRIRNYTTF